ncbi:MAG: VTT domain-containing protein [bacterium]
MNNNSGMDVLEYEKKWYKILFKRLNSVATLKFLLLLGVIILSGVLLAVGKVPLTPDKFKDWVADKGILGPIVLIIINNISVFNPFIPNQIIHITAGALYGAVGGFLIIYPASIVGWTFNYYLGYKLGHHFVANMIGESNLNKLDELVKKAKLRDFIILIFTPGLSYDVLGYVSGSVKANAKAYILGGIIGSIIPTFVTVAVGELFIDTPWIGIGLTILGIACSLGYGWYILKKKRK